MSKDVCGRKAVSILEKLEALYRENGDVELKPDLISYNSVIKALARSLDDEAAAKAEEYLNRVKAAYEAGDVKIAPDCRTVSYLICFSCLPTCDSYTFYAFI